LIISVYFGNGSAPNLASCCWLLLSHRLDNFDKELRFSRSWRANDASFAYVRAYDAEVDGPMMHLLAIKCSAGSC